MVNTKIVISCMTTAIGLFLICSCGRHVIPRNYKYSNSGFSLNEQSQYAEIKLDTSAIYVYEWEGVREYGKVKLFNVMKFHSDGKFQFTTFENLSEIAKLQSPPDETIHYYKIENRILKLEVYLNSMVGFDYWEGNIYEDSLIFFKVNKIKENLVYKKM